MDQVEVGQGMHRIIGMIIREGMLEIMWECIKILEDRVEEDIEEIIEMRIITEKEVGVGVGKDHFQGILIIEEITEKISNSRSRSGSRPSTNRDKIRCYKCREYDHFVRDCPTSKEEGDRANSANV